MGDAAQSEYEKAYERLHGKPPVIRRSGSWLLIGEGPDWQSLKCRKSDLPLMTSYLEWCASQKETQ